MGMCLSGDVRGGKQAVGGAQGRPTEAHNNNKIAGGGDGHNDAVDFFFRSRGLHALFTQIELSLSASKLRDCDITSKSDPMAVVYAKKREGTLEEIGRTEVVMNSLNPAWIVKVSIAYQFEIVQPLVFHVYDVDTKYHNVSVKVLKSQLFVDKYIEKEQYTFLDYISSGFELNFMVAVDFTASNGNPRNPNSLHYIDPSGRLNSYQQTIIEVGEILDADNGRLVSSTGRMATRDIVQFVPIRDVHSGRISAVQALLEELHGQFLSYVRAGDIKPRNLQVA
ncbi:hypothetical protein Q3G72_011691 [Acer saccharum]|nr:hypothetical protein Q3G72_011691 [Acer saccharum]